MHTRVCHCVYDVHVCLVLSRDKCVHTCTCVWVCVCTTCLHVVSVFFTSRMQIIHKIYLFMVVYVYDYHSLAVCIIILKIVITVLDIGLHKTHLASRPS